MTAAEKTPAQGHGRILLFVPMYNCAPQIGRVIAQLTPEVRQLFSELIVVDNRSTDDGQPKAIAALSALDGFPAKLLMNDANYGLGGSHKVAFDYMLEHGLDHVVVLHGDDQGSVSDLVPLLRDGVHLQHDCLLGARFMRGSRLTGYSAMRTLGNRVFNAIYSVAAGARIYDLGSGLNLYSRAALRDRQYLRCADDLTFNYHMILRSIAAGHSLRFFPLEWREDDQISNVKLVRQSLRVLGIAADYALRRKRYLAGSYAASPGRSYTHKVVFEHGAIGGKP